MNDIPVISVSTGTIIAFLTSRLEEISKDLEILKSNHRDIHAKLDSIQGMLDVLAFGIRNIKMEKREIDEKIALSYKYIDRFIGRFATSESPLSIEDHQEILRQKVLAWDKLEAETKKFLGTADFIYSSLQHNLSIENTDFSPSVIEFCRAVENELFMKIYKPFILDFVKTHNSEIENVLVADVANKVTRILAQQVIKEKTGTGAFLTLGQMKYYLTRLSSAKDKKSFLLKDFHSFVNAHFNVGLLLAQNNIEVLKKIIDEHRNKAAHINILKIASVRKCKDTVINYIDLLLDTQISTMDKIGK